MILSAVIFDLNGTVLEDEDKYNEAFNKVLNTLGVNTEKPVPHERGIGVKENWDIYLKKFNIQTDKTSEDLAVQTQKEYLNFINEITLKPGFEDFIQNLKDSGVKTALATSNTWEVTMRILDEVGISDVFDSVTTAEEAKYLKPEPDLFLVAAEKLGVETGRCLVIEDAPSGVEAAKRAGMKVVAITDNEDYAQKLSNADLVVEGFSEITPKVIDQL